MTIAGAAVESIALFGTTFQNPIILAAGTAGFGRELAETIDLESLGGIVSKAVSVDPRAGNRSPGSVSFPAG